MSDYILGLYRLVEQRVGSGVLTRIATASLVSTLIAMAGRLFLNKREQEKAKKYNDKKIREIREKQIRAWEHERGQNLKEGDRTEKDNSLSESSAKEERKKGGLNWPGSSSSGHLNPHFSHLSSYRPSVSKRYPCKRCCG